MKNTKYRISEECIGCQACVDVADSNFDMNGNMAFMKLQPQNEEQISSCDMAMNICPVDAISKDEETVENKVKPILSDANIKETLDKYPDLKAILVNLSPKFAKLQKPALYNTLARFASFKDAAKLTGVSVCEILHTINDYLGVSEELINNAPECISINAKENQFIGEDIIWQESAERYILNDDTLAEIVTKVNELKAQENIVIISVDKPYALLKTVDGFGYKYNIEEGREFRISVFNSEVEIDTHWHERMEEFEILDVRRMSSDPFDIIIKKAYDTIEDDGFRLVQRFEPIPIINMLSEMGYEHETRIASEQEIHVFFHKKVRERDADEKEDSDKPNVVIQSATPVAYPIIMRLLQSDKIRKAVNIKELKVWEETEKHLGWIVNGKADISFSAVITSAKLKDNDVKIPALFVWDNFSILTRGYKAKKLEDLIGHTIETPLFAEAPPAKITKYVIEAKGLNYDDFDFSYGEPFGRPEEILRNFVRGVSDTVILREPEVSYAINILKKMGEEVSILSYNKLWNEINDGFGSFPNAGILFKGEFVRNNPEIAQVVLDELKDAIKWVNENKTDAANLSFDMMRQSPENVELFLNRVNFTYVEGDELVAKVEDYFKILIDQGILETKVDQKLLDMFKL
ncbi:MAG: ferredoxin [Bacteroidales bacterium]|nr:ferredoxin [Bacteroidales bacterium]